MNTLVTVITDASYRDGVAGFHYWFKSAHATAEDTGTAQDVESSCHAELLGIFAGIMAVYEHHGPTPLDFVIQCDSTQALGILLKHTGARIAKTSKIRFGVPGRTTEAEVRLAVQIRAVVGPEARLWLKHVKGHSSINDARHKLNRFADKKAREALNKASRDS